MPPSRRWPGKDTRTNTADQIEESLTEDGHRVWGVVIYRCTYDNDDNWNKFVEQLRRKVTETLEFYNGLDLLDSFRLTVIDDKDLLDGASTSVVREHFKQWVATAVEQEQGQGVEAGFAQRYRYCIQVDEDAVDSVVVDLDEREKEKGYSEDGYVDLISKDWEPNPPGSKDEGEEPIEGCTQHDVGWMSVKFGSVLGLMYYYMRWPHEWEREYRRAPEVAHD